MNNRVIDVFCHWLPKRYYKAVLKYGQKIPYMLERASNMPVMVDLDIRFALMDKLSLYQQIPSIVSPGIEGLVSPDKAIDLARIANDEMAEVTARHRERFPGFVASLPLNNIEESLHEMKRCVNSLGALGVQVFTNINGSPLDEPEYLSLFELAAQMHVPVWLHPVRNMSHADYSTEKISKYELWWALGWPYETTVAMARLVFSGIFERWPNLTVITHHLGGITPMLEGRLNSGLDVMGVRTPPEYSHAVTTKNTGKAINDFYKFYADTASFGSSLTIECGLSFFGKDKLLFASDMPFGSSKGGCSIRETLDAIDRIGLSDSIQKQILSENARKLLNIP